MNLVPKASRDLIALTLAVGIAVALNMVTLAVLINAANSSVNSGGLSENGTQVLTGWGGGIIGILGAVFGYRAGQQSTADNEAARASAVEAYREAEADES